MAEEEDKGFILVPSDIGENPEGSEHSLRTMEAVGKQAYRLKLPPTYSRIHDVFHVSLLEPYYNRRDRASTTPEPIPIEDQDE
jgi:hypothetical protein